MGKYPAGFQALRIFLFLTSITLGVESISRIVALPGSVLIVQRLASIVLYPLATLKLGWAAYAMKPLRPEMIDQGEYPTDHPLGSDS